MVCEQFDMDTWDDILELAKPRSGGGYTSVGNYPVEELHGLVKAMSDILKTNKEILYSSFGEYLAGVFVKKFPDFFTESTSTFELLMNVDQYIHAEVRKLYPDASLPKLDGVMSNKREMTLEYESKNSLSHFAVGLIYGVARYYKEKVSVAMVHLKADEGEHVIFYLNLE